MNRPLNTVLLVRQYLRQFTVDELRRKIRTFKNLNIRRMQAAAVEAAVLDAITVGSPASAVLPVYATNYPKGTRFFRIRRFLDGLNPVTTVADCWCPPPDKTTMGRVNREGNPVLYTSPRDPLVAVAEMGAADGDRCMVLQYEATEEIRLGWITDQPAPHLEASFDGDELVKLNMLRDFFVDEFTREVGIGTEHLYITSNIIAESYFNYPNTGGYCYPTTVRKAGFYNVAFFAGAAKQLLTLSAICECSFYPAGDPSEPIPQFYFHAKFRVDDNGKDLTRV